MQVLVSCLFHYLWDSKMGIHGAVIPELMTMFFRNKTESLGFAQCGDTWLSSIHQTLQPDAVLPLLSTWPHVQCSAFLTSWCSTWTLFVDSTRTVSGCLTRAHASRWRPARTLYNGLTKQTGFDFCLWVLSSEDIVSLHQGKMWPR